jgi:hypothetical protein
MRSSEALIDRKGNKGNWNEIAGKHLVRVFDEILPADAANRSLTRVAGIVPSSSSFTHVDIAPGLGSRIILRPSILRLVERSWRSIRSFCSRRHSGTASLLSLTGVPMEEDAVRGGALWVLIEAAAVASESRSTHYLSARQ